MSIRVIPIHLAIAAVAVAVAVAVPAQADADAGATASGARVFKLGSKGPTVRRIQRRLGVRPVSGRFGRATKRKVKRFQRRRGLAVDGVVGPATLRAMGISRLSRAERIMRRTLRRIAACESGGNPRAVSSNGRYRGKYQFSRATWRSLGGRGDPAKASERLQDRMARKLYKLRGTAPWAGCV